MLNCLEPFRKPNPDRFGSIVINSAQARESPELAAATTAKL